MQGPNVRPALCASLATLVLVFPWINPLAGGPTPAVIPWLVSAACASVLCLLATVCRMQWERIFRNAWLLAALVNAVFGLLQYFDAGALLGGLVNATGPGSAFGNLRQRNQFASLMNIGLLALLSVRVSGAAGAALSGLSPAPAVSGWMSVAAAVLLALGLAASSSRTGMLQLAAIAALVVWWRWWRRADLRRIVLAAIAAYLLGSVALPYLAGFDPYASGILARFAEPRDSCESRLVLWGNVLHLISLKPWAGWGWGELDQAHFMALYPGARFCDILDNAHNLPLHLAVELGVPLALLVCGLLAWLVLRARPWRETDERRRMAWAVLALIGLHSLLEYPLWYGPFQISVVLAVWILWRTAAPAARGNSPAVQVPPMSAPAWVAGCATAVLLAVAYAGWDYYRVSQIYREPERRAAAYRADTLAKVQDSWLFRNQVRFAALTLSSVTPDNAMAINRGAHALLRFSPEARVVEKLIDSALALHRTDEAAFFMRRFRVAYPKDFARWRETRETVADLPPIDP